MTAAWLQTVHVELLQTLRLGVSVQALRCQSPRTVTDPSTKQSLSCDTDHNSTHLAPRNAARVEEDAAAPPHQDRQRRRRIRAQRPLARSWNTPGVTDVGAPHRGVPGELRSDDARRVSVARAQGT